MDYYSLLGVNRNATPEEIKKAYKKQSMRHHPDRGGDENKFKEVNEAYRTLIDPVKRQQYDNPQPQFNFNSSNVDDIFSHFGFQRSNQRQKNRDIQLKYILDIKDCYTGRGVTLNYKLPSGKTEFVDVRIPPGIKNNDTIHFKGLGDDTYRQLPRGDLIVNLQIKIPRNWTIKGYNITMEHPVNVLDLITGANLDIETPEGKGINLKIPKGTNPGTTFNVHNYGLLNRNTGKKGNLYIKVIGITPVITNSKDLDKLAKMRKKV